MIKHHNGDISHKDREDRWIIIIALICGDKYHICDPTFELIYKSFAKHPKQN